MQQVTVCLRDLIKFLLFYRINSVPTDLCWTCQTNSTLIMRAVNTSDEEKSQVVIIVVPYTVINTEIHSLPHTLFLFRPPNKRKAISRSLNQRDHIIVKYVKRAVTL